MEEISGIKDYHLKLTQYVAKYQVRKKGIENSVRGVKVYMRTKNANCQNKALDNNKRCIK